MAASAGPGSHSAKKSSLQTGVHKKSKAGKHKRKMSKLQKKKAIARAKAMHNAQKKEKRVAHMRDGLKKIAKHSKKAKPAKLANS